MNDTNSFAHTIWNCEYQYNVSAEIPEKGVLWGKEKGSRRNLKNTVRMEEGKIVEPLT